MARTIRFGTAITAICKATSTVRRSTRSSAQSRRGISVKIFENGTGVNKCKSLILQTFRSETKCMPVQTAKKISVIYEGQQYMLKFPPPPTKNKDMSYSNSCFSEYLGCQIYESIGIPVQKNHAWHLYRKGEKKSWWPAATLQSRVSPPTGFRLPEKTKSLTLSAAATARNCPIFFTPLRNKMQLTAWR